MKTRGSVSIDSPVIAASREPILYLIVGNLKGFVRDLDVT